MALQLLMEEVLTRALSPIQLQIEDESRFHSSMSGTETHFKILCVSEKFQGLSLIERHRRVNTLLKDAFSKGLHALSLQLLTPEEWDKSKKVRVSPPCASSTD